MKPFWIAVGVLLSGIAAEFIVILFLNAGHFTFSLDDPYIHLALSENISNGHYGLNANEYSAPASSILFPFLLAVFVPLPGVVYLLLIINVLSAVGTLYLFWKIVTFVFAHNANQRYANANIAVLLLLLIPATNMIGLIFTGMEHSLQVLFVTLVFWGLIREAERSTVAWWLGPALVVAPMVRYENLAICVPGLLYLFLRGHYRLSVAAGIAIAVIVGGFSVCLLWLGLNPFPASVTAKSDLIASGGSRAALLENLTRNLSTFQGIVLLVGTLFFLYIGFFGKREQNERLLNGVVASSIVLHLLVGRFGWYARYEIYIWTIAILAGLYLNRTRLSHFSLNHGPLKLGALASVCTVLLCAPYIDVLATTPFASNNIYEQQYQMHRFAAEYYNRPVAVNDLGYVAFRNSNYVLDLWGVSSLEAQFYRGREAGSSDWLNTISESHSVRLAMIFDSWFPDKPSNWSKIGELRLGRKRIAAVPAAVSFYTLDRELDDEVVELLKEFRRTLPKGVEIVLEEKRYYH